MPRIALTKAMSMLSKRALVGPTAPVQLEEVAEPDLPSPHWVRVKTRLCGICGSDVKIVRIRGAIDNPITPFISFPHVLGHEGVGEVAEVGPAVTRIRIGQRILLNPWLSCEPRGIEPPCPACAGGNVSLCRNFARGALPPGIHNGNNSLVNGPFAPTFIAHESQCVPIPDELEWEQAVTGDPFSVSFHGILIRPPADGETALVIGCGTLGLLAIHALKALWPRTRVLAAYRYEHQKELALRFGADLAVPARPVQGLLEAVAQATDARIHPPWFGRAMLMGGVDVVYDTVSDPETVEISIRVARERGTVVLIGMEASKRFEWSPIMFKELVVTGSMAFGAETFEGRRMHAMEHYLELVRAGRVDARPILTHRFPLDDWREAFATLLDKGRTRAVKAVFTF